MKLKSLLFLVCFGLLSNVFAVNLHMSPIANAEDKQSAAKNLTYPGFCQIEIINNSFSDVTIFGTFDDGSTVAFDMYYTDPAHYISLFYYGYCHNQMHINIQSSYYTLYSAWTNVNSTIRILPYLKNQPKAAVSAR